MAVTDAQSERLLRLLLWVGLEQEQQHRVVDVLTRIISDVS